MAGLTTIWLNQTNILVDSSDLCLVQPNFIQFDHKSRFIQRNGLIR